MKRVLACFLLSLFLLFASAPSLVLAAGSTIENGSFETESTMWNAGVFSTDTPAVGLRCLSFCSPVSANEDTHRISYIPNLSLLGQSIYTLSFYIRSTAPSENTSPATSVLLIDESQKKLTFCVRGVSDGWEKLSIPFLLDSIGVYSLSIQIEGIAADGQICLDDVALTKLDFEPETLSVVGNRMPTIPSHGTATYSYVPVSVNADGAYIEIKNAILRAVSLPQGVSFDATENRLSVDSTANACDFVLLECALCVNETPFLSETIRITLSDNMVQNGSFSDFPLCENWENASTSFLIEQADNNRFANVCMRKENAGYTGELSPLQSFVLQADTLYVFRANFRSTFGWGAYPTRAAATISDENCINISVSGIGSDLWAEAIAAFRVPADGIYALKINVFSEDARPIFVDSISLQKEVLAPSLIYFDIPPHIAAPDEGEYQISIPSAIFNQEGTPCDVPLTFSVSPEGQGVSVRENQLFISINAVPQTYILRATAASGGTASAERAFSVSTNFIGDGSFEETQPGALWTTAQPSLLHFASTYNQSYPTQGQRMAKLTMNGPVSALLSASAAWYSKGNSYVFEADIKTVVPDIPTVVTVLIENMSSNSFDDNLVVGQFTVSKELQHIELLFTPSVSTVGRLMIAFNTPDTHNQQKILFDAISVKKAITSASEVQITGIADVNMNITGKYRFDANFETVDASTYRWLISDSATGIFIPLEGQTRSTLSITQNMLWKFLKFEVTPISLHGPVVGQSSSSAVVRVGAPIPTVPADPSSTPPISVPETQPGVDAPSKPSLLVGNLHVLDLEKFSSAKADVFLDLEQHWAKSEIELLSAAGIVEGRGNGLFEPGAQITRAEFSAFLARAFELAPIFYENQFEDVKSYHWYAGAVAVITKHGITNGTSEKTFSPELPITREEMAAMIMRAYRKTNAPMKEDQLSFADAATISAWAKRDIAQSAALSFICGFTDGRFLPRQTATRAEAAVLIKRMLSYVAQVT